jgi:hypothetical protein
VKREKMSASADQRSSSPLLLQGVDELNTFIRIIAKDFPKLAEFCRLHEEGCASVFEITEEAGGFTRLSCRACGDYVRLREVI